MLYNWRARRIALGPIDVFRPHANGAALAPSHVFGWPVFVNGQLTLFSSSCTAQYLTCGGGHVWSVTTSTLSDPNSYHPTPMTTDGSAPWEPMSISVGRYPTALRLIEIDIDRRRLQDLRDSEARGPWQLRSLGNAPRLRPQQRGLLPRRRGSPRAQHTEPSIFISYKDPNSGPGGHMVISTVTLR